MSPQLDEGLLSEVSKVMLVMLAMLVKDGERGKGEDGYLVSSALNCARISAQQQPTQGWTDGHSIPAEINGMDA